MPPAVLLGVSCRYVIPVSGLIGFLLLGIDQIAIHLEEPFGILPLEAICDTITRNLDVSPPWSSLVHPCKPMFEFVDVSGMHMRTPSSCRPSPHLPAACFVHSRPHPVPVAVPPAELYVMVAWSC